MTAERGLNQPPLLHLKLAFAGHQSLPSTFWLHHGALDEWAQIQKPARMQPHMLPARANSCARYATPTLTDEYLWAPGWRLNSQLPLDLPK
jgi:hypothetical protein